MHTLQIQYTVELCEEFPSAREKLGGETREKLVKLKKSKKTPIHFWKIMNQSLQSVVQVAPPPHNNNAMLRPESARVTEHAAPMRTDLFIWYRDLRNKSTSCEKVPYSKKSNKQNVLQLFTCHQGVVTALRKLQALLLKPVSKYEDCENWGFFIFFWMGHFLT